MVSYSRTFKVAILASGRVLTSCAGLLSAAVLARILSKTDLGTYRQTLLAYNFAAPLLMLGLPQALYYFMPSEKERARGILLENLILLSLMGAVFSCFLLFGGNRLLAWRFSNPVLEKTLLVLVPYPLFALPAAALSACLIVQDRPKQIVVYNVASRLVLLVVVVAVCLIWRTPFAAIVGVVLGTGILLLPALSMMFEATRGTRATPRLSGMMAQVKYSVPLGVATTLGTVTMAMDKIIVSSKCTTEEFAVFANGAMELPLVGMVTGSITLVILVEMRALIAKGERAPALRLFQTAATKSASILLPTAVFLFICAESVIEALYTSEYRESVVPFRLYLCIMPIRIVYYGAALMAMGRSKFILWRSFTGLLVNFVLSILLVEKLGYIGPVLGTLLALYFWEVPLNIVVIARFFSCPSIHLFPLKELAKISSLTLLPGAVLLLAHGCIPIQNPFVRLALDSALYWPILCAELIHFKMVDTERWKKSAARFMKKTGFGG